MSAEAVVATPAQAARLEHGAAIVLEPLREFLDQAGLGTGELTASPIGEGHSNLTFMIERGGERWVLRRPPRGQLSASANDVLRESAVLEALDGTAVPVPRVLARCEDEDVIGAPFFVMAFVEGEVVADALPPGLDGAGAPAAIARALTETVAALHGLDLAATGLGRFGKPSGYLERQLRTFTALLEQNATRPLPDLERVGEWLREQLPETAAHTFVHGDYRLGNVLLRPPARLAAVLDWEMATVGDPLADLGYLTAMWTEPGDRPNPMFALSRVTARGDFPTRADLARAYAETSGRDVSALPWYQVLALWKSAIFLEGSFRRYREGASSDPFFATLEAGVPALAEAARERIERLDAAAP